MRDQPEQFIQWLVLLLTYVVSKDLAYLLGPYIALCIAASAGAALALGSSKPMKWRQVVFYVGLRIVMAIVLTVAIAELLYGVTSMSKMAALGLMPIIAFCIGVIQDYRKVLDVAMFFVKRRARTGDK